MIYETFSVSLYPLTLERLHSALRILVNEEENVQVKQQLEDLANEIRSRMQRIARGDIQQQSSYSGPLPGSTPKLDKAERRRHRRQLRKQRRLNAFSNQAVEGPDVELPED